MQLGVRRWVVEEEVEEGRDRGENSSDVEGPSPTLFCPG